MKLSREVVARFDKTDIGQALIKYENAFASAVEADTRDDSYPSSKTWKKSEAMRDELVRLLLIQTLGVPFVREEKKDERSA